MKGEAAVFDELGHAFGDAKGLQPPQEQADIRQVVAAAAARNPSHIDDMRHGVERGPRPHDLPLPPQIGHRVMGRPHMVKMLRHADLLEVFHRPCLPSRHIRGQLLDYRHSALAASVGNRIGYFGP